MRARSVAAHLTGAAPQLPRGIFVAVLLILSVAFAGATHARAQEDDDEAAPALLLIMDSSGSMNASDGAGGTKIQAAKSALNGVVDALPNDTLVGLRVYGHRIPNTNERRGCKDTELIVPVGPLERGGMKQRIRSYDAKGFTPIGLSLQQGARDLPAEGKRTIVLVSDGIDTCAPPPPCKVAKRLTQQGVDLRIDTVGFQVDPRARKELQCIARVAEGSYFDAGSSAELSDQLSRLSLRALRTFETTGTAVTGGSSTASAPTLESGQFTDSISPGDELHYAVELAEGQALGAAVTSVGTIDFLGTLYLTLESPTEEFIADNASVATGGNLESIGVQSATVGPASSDDRMHEAGTYYLTVALDSRGEADDEYPIEMVVEVTGDPVTPSPTEEPDPPGDEDDDPTSAIPDGTSGGNTLMLTLGGLAFGLLGAALGALGGRKLVGGR